MCLAMSVSVGSGSLLYLLLVPSLNVSVNIRNAIGWILRSVFRSSPAKFKIHGGNGFLERLSHATPLISDALGATVLRLGFSYQKQNSGNFSGRVLIVVHHQFSQMRDKNNCPAFPRNSRRLEKLDRLRSYCHHFMIERGRTATALYQIGDNNLSITPKRI